MMWFAQLVGLSERWQFNPEAFFSLSLSLSLSLIFFFSPIVRELVLSLTRLSFRCHHGRSQGEGNGTI